MDADPLAGFAETLGILTRHLDTNDESLRSEGVRRVSFLRSANTYAANAVVRPALIPERFSKRRWQKIANPCTKSTKRLSSRLSLAESPSSSQKSECKTSTVPPIPSLLEKPLPNISPSVILISLD